MATFILACKQGEILPQQRFCFGAHNQQISHLVLYALIYAKSNNFFSSFFNTQSDSAYKSALADGTLL